MKKKLKTKILTPKMKARLADDVIASRERKGTRVKSTFS